MPLPHPIYSVANNSTEALHHLKTLLPKENRNEILSAIFVLQNTLTLEIKQSSIRQ